MRPALLARPVLLAFLACAPTGAAHAQMQLPGAAAPAPAAPAQEQGVAVRAPEEAGLLGRDLFLNGAQGRMRLERRGQEIVITHLKLAGERMSRRGETCEVEFTEGPFRLKPQRRHEGLRRYEAAIAVCPFTLDVLSGAAQASLAGAYASSPLAGVCEFKAADCKAAVAGVWGPLGARIGEAEIAQIERARGAAERNAQANYRALVAAAGKDRDKVRVIAAEQAGFSSKRAERCGDYEGEERHGFCASRITEAWAVALRARLNPSGFEAEEQAVAARARQTGQRVPARALTP